ncbi:MAG: 3-deoxy-manno-octulosonate cytidylyltransferase [Euryarchaeota archaeon]|nr:3-deoxy-manno-octulosonate cytidylyltransferase [Euryarchaeota archaeon]
MKVLGIIPARFGASRFPGKLLADLEGMTVLERVYRAAERARELEGLWVATADEEIVRAVKAFGGRVLMTSTRPGSGTERLAEAARDLSADGLINIQGDEPLLDPRLIDQVAVRLREEEEAVAITLKKAISDPAEAADPNTVKVVTDRSGFALYFSRSPIPHPGTRAAYKHIGLYGYRRDFLLKFARLPAGPLEKEERLEQLRILENGYKIKVLETAEETIGIDTPEDLERARRFIRRNDNDRNHKHQAQL